MLTIIEIEAGENGHHGVQSQSHRTECWLEGWVAVPETLQEKVWACGGYCDLTLNDAGELVDVEIGEYQEQEEADGEPTEVERLRADLDYLATMAGVEL